MLAGLGEVAPSGSKPRQLVDHELVNQLRGLVVEELQELRRTQELAGRLPLTDADERQLGRSLVSRTLAEHRADQVRLGVPLSTEDEDLAVTEAIHNALFGLGRMAPLLADPTLSEVNINGCDRVTLIRDDGTKAVGDPVAGSDEELIAWVRSMATYTQLNSRSFDASNPQLRCRLPDGSRLSAIMGASERPVLSIRMLRRPRVTLDDLRVLGAFDEQVQSFLEACVLARLNFILSGATHSGKTTLARGMCHAIPASERIVTVERFRELGLEDHPDLHPDVVELEEQPANNEGVGGQSLASLVQFSRNLDPDRLILGETLGSEVVTILEGMSQGNDGGFTTIHARSAEEVPARVATYAFNGGMPQEQAMLLFSNAIDLVVHLAADRQSDGSLQRYIAGIKEIGEYQGGVLTTTEVYRRRRGEPFGTWLSMGDRLRDQLAQHGFVWAEAVGVL